MERITEVQNRIQKAVQAQWQESHKRLSFNQISLTANDSTLSGQAQVTLTEKPEWQLRLQFPQLNLDNLIPLNETANGENGAAQQGQSQSTLPRPVISSRIDEPGRFSSETTRDHPRICGEKSVSKRGLHEIFRMENRKRQSLPNVLLWIMEGW